MDSINTCKFRFNTSLLQLSNLAVVGLFLQKKLLEWEIGCRKRRSQSGEAFLSAQLLSTNVHDISSR